ncbi:MAG TPA: hypothetical protein VGF13_20550 [Verrucomicrobiae bacterium]|jgi:hypothetical protein
MEIFTSRAAIGRVVRFNGTNGLPIGDFAMGGLNLPIGLEFGPPRLDSIVRVGTNVIISWSGRSDTQLQLKTNLWQVSWQDVTNSPGRASITNSVSNSAAFYRLIRD